MALWLPESASRDELERRAENNARLLRHVEIHSKMKEWNKRLKEIDPNLQLVKARNDTKLPGLVPGYWHVIRHNPGAAPGIIVHQGPDGEFREPDSGLFRELAEGDLWNDRVRQAKEKRRKQLEQAEQRQREREREERLDELMGRAKAAWAPGVLIKRDI